MPRARSRIKKVSYVLQVTCDKIPDMNEKDFLGIIRGVLHQHGICLDKQSPKVSVVRRVEEFINPGEKEPS